MAKGKYKMSQVLMTTKSGYEHMFESITEAAKFAKVNAWTMSLKMEVFGHFEDKQGNKYIRQDKMNTKNEYISSSPKITKEYKKGKKGHSRAAKKVIVDGIVYNSLIEAETKLNFPKDVLGMTLRNGRTKYKNHTVAYFDEKSVQELMDTNKMPELVDFKPKVEIKDENISVVIDSKDPAIKLINDRIVDILKKAGVYEEIQRLSEAIKKLSK